jgi:hypothetical protein
VSAIAWAYSAGAALELLGLSLVAWDVRDAARKVKEMSQPDWHWTLPEEERIGVSLFELMARVSAGNLRRRAAGVALIAVGLIVQTVANVAAL